MKRMWRSACRRAVIVMIPALGIGACASPAPVQLYALSAHEPPIAPGAAVMPAPTRGIVIEPVSVPRYADIPQLVFSAADGRSQISEDHRWRAPLADEIAGALAQRLQARYGVMDVGRVGTPEGTPVVRLRVDVQRFEALPGSGEVLVSAAWSLRLAPSTQVALQCAAQLRRPVEAADPEALVRAYRAAVESLGDQIGRAVQDVLAPAAGAAAPMCPPAA
jgi:uncharacterized lipoprotein YmbA